MRSIFQWCSILLAGLASSFPPLALSRLHPKVWWRCGAGEDDGGVIYPLIVRHESPPKVNTKPRMFIAFLIPQYGCNLSRHNVQTLFMVRVRCLLHLRNYTKRGLSVSGVSGSWGVLMSVSQRYHNL